MKIYTLIILMLGILSLNAQSTDYQLDKSKSELTWTGFAALTTYKMSGNIKPESGALHFKNDSLEGGMIIMDMKSLNAEVKQLETHLKQKDFFEVEGYPKAKFVITTVQLSGSTYNLKGQLTIKNITQEEEIEVTIAEKDGQLFVSGKAKIDRTIYGIYYNSSNFFQNLGEQAIADEFELDFNLIFERVNLLK